MSSPRPLIHPGDRQGATIGCRQECLRGLRRESPDPCESHRLRRTCGRRAAVPGARPVKRFRGRARRCVAAVLFADELKQNREGAGGVEVVIETAKELGAGSTGEGPRGRCLGDGSPVCKILHTPPREAGLVEIMHAELHRRPVVLTHKCITNSPKVVVHQRITEPETDSNCAISASWWGTQDPPPHRADCIGGP